MSSAQHHIRKQFLDFDFTSKSAALEWQQKVPFKYQHEYVKIIEAVLNRYDDGSCIEIDNVIIDIGEVKEKDIALRIGEELDSALKRIIQSDSVIPKNGIVQPTSETSKELRIKNVKEEVLDVFLYFISQGHFPWHKTIWSISNLEEQLLKLFSISDLVLALKRNKVLEKDRQKTRFFYQFSSHFVLKIVRQYFKTEFAELNRTAEFCESQLKKPFFKPYVKDFFESKIADDVTQWILLPVSEKRIFWSWNFTKWYIEKNWLHELPIWNEKEWKALNNTKSEDTSQFKEEHLKKVFADLEIIVKEELLQQGSSSNEKNKVAADSNSREKNNHISKEKEAPSDEKSKAEITRSSNEGTELPHTENLDGTDVLNKDSKAVGLEDGLSGTDGMDNSISTKKDSRPSTTDSNNEHKDDKKDKGRSNISADELANNEVLKNEIEETEQRIQFDSLLGAETSSEDSDNETVSNQIKQKEFYTTVQETIDSILPPEKNFSKTEESTSTLPPDNYYINDSGLVLVWPYLSRLFENLKYTSGNQFASKEQQERAVLLLGHIARGKEACEEHELVFSKFLCNWSFQMPVIHPFELTEKEREEVKSMLKGLIAHWSILKNTSIDGLRETFFWREGKLEEKEEHWKLVIEQKGTDILLNHLPYGISMIKLPWHKKMLRVDWA